MMAISLRCFTASVWLTAAFATAQTADTKDSKSDKNTPPGSGSVAVSLEAKANTLPIPAKLAISERFRYCIAKGFNRDEDGVPFKPLPETMKVCDLKDEQELVGVNGDSIVAALATDTEYKVVKSGKSDILAFCLAKECSKQHDERLAAMIKSLARPSPAYFEDTEIPIEKAEEIAPKIGIKSRKAITGRALDKTHIRLEADRKPEPLVLSSVRKMIADAVSDLSILKKVTAAAGDSNATRIPLPQICVSTILSGSAPDAPDTDGKCKAGARLVQAANAAEIATALAGIEKVTVKADGSGTGIIVSCTSSTCARDTLDAIGSSVSQLARPDYAYTEDLEVLPETAAFAVSAVSKWSGGKIAAEALSGRRLRLKSNIQVDAKDVEALKSHLSGYGFGLLDSPFVQRMFYADPGAVVSSLSGTPVPVTPLAPGTTAPVTGNPETTAPSAAPTTSASTASSTAPGGTTTPSTTASTGTATPNSGAGGTTNVSFTVNPASGPAPAAPASAPGTNTINSGMVSFGDDVIFTDPLKTAASDWERVRLLTLLDLPRPEVLLNMWSLQESSPDGRDISRRNEEIREAVSAHNDVLQNAIEYGWEYLSRQMQKPEYFDPTFYSYVTQRFVSDPPECASGKTGCISPEDRVKWGLCPAGTYCLGYAEAFQPMRPTLTNILLGIMASSDPFKTVFTTIGCMGGKYEVYGADCFPERDAITNVMPPPERLPKGLNEKQCLAEERKAFLHSKERPERPSCELLDLAAMEAHRQCHLPATLPLSCFTLQAAQSFLPYQGFSTFSLDRLNDLAEKPIADLESKLPKNDQTLATTPLGLLRSATVNFLFNYKLSQEFPREFSAYILTHSAQELNAEFNPLIVAFNQDVAAFSRDVMNRADELLPRDSGWFEFWRRYRSSIADGLITVRGISGIESLVDTDTQSSFNASRAQNFSSFLSSALNPSGAGSAAAPQSTCTAAGGDSCSGSGTPTAMIPTPAGPAYNLQSIARAAFPAANLPQVLAALAPVAATAQIGRQLTIDVVPHALPGASSAELDVKLWAQEDSAPTLYADNGASPQNDQLSRVARHNVFTRVRVESIKLFELSSFSALVQRPRTKLPIIPPLLEIPLLNELVGLPLPGAKVYHRSTAVISAVIVPTAYDLAYGIEFLADREAVLGARTTFERVRSIRQFPESTNIYGFHRAMVNCLATHAQSAIAGSNGAVVCPTLRFSSLPPDRN